MTDYRDRSYFRNQDDDRNDEPGQRWRRSEERYRREAGAQSENRFDDDRYEANRRNRDFGYGRTYRDDELGGGSYGSGQYGQGRSDWRGSRTYGPRETYATRDYGSRDGSRDDGQPVHWHEHDREQRAGHPYTGTYGGTGDSSYFTGSQGSWAVGDPRASRSRAAGSYGGQQFGSDYRSHRYADHDDDRRGFWDRASDEVASWFGDEDAARRREQDHRGHGPKDYKRSDERIREDANDRLTEDWRVDASNVTVAVANGEITLTGTVASREAKRRAEDVVDRISGVKHVQNNLRVETVGSGGSYSGNWATGSTTTPEGGTLSRNETGAKTTTTTSKV